ncbi:MAG: hypothetical protein KBT33_01200 [Prevotellaceae bacterium]|nr:hypothetical protein [Candidatus Minthosoma equi]
MLYQNKLNHSMMLKAFCVVSVAALSISAFATQKSVKHFDKTVQEEIEKNEKTAMDEGIVYAVCEPSCRIVRFTNNPNEEGIRFFFSKKYVFVDDKPITDKHIQNPNMMKGCTYHLVQLGAHIGVDIKTEKYAKKNGEGSK